MFHLKCLFFFFLVFQFFTDVFFISLFCINMWYKQASSMPPPGHQVPSDARCFSLVMIAFIDSICHSFIIEYKILARGSGTCPTSCSFVPLRLVFFFFLFISTKQNFNCVAAVFVIIIYGVC